MGVAMVLAILVAGAAAQSDTDIDVLTEAVRANPRNFAVRLNRAAFYAARGHDDHAFDDYNIVISSEKDPTILARAYNGRGDVFLRRSEYKMAMDDFNEAI